jgi:peptide/nickel transport system substrate-binding protein
MLRLLSTLLVCLVPLAAACAAPKPGIAMHGEPRHSADFAGVDYVNPDAPKGGKVSFAAQGSFDNVNPLIVKGEPVAGVREYVFESLMARSLDEPFSLYGLLAESIDVPDDRSSAEFVLREGARFSDGQPLTVEDVIFSLEVLRDHGRPNYRSYYAKVTRVEKTGERGVKFTFASGGDREMPLIIGLMPVLPRHKFAAETFEKTTLAPLTGSGPYVIAHIDAGKSIEYRRDPNYWGRDLPVNRGMYNFDTIRYDYFRDANSMFEAFRKGLYSLRTETDPTRWATAYTFPALHDGRVAAEKFATGVPAGMTGLVFNTRRPIFADVRVREALAGLFDFTWINNNLYYGLYTRTDSYFARSELSSPGKPADARELELLAAFPGVVRPDILDGSYRPPNGDSDGYNRAGLQRSLALLREAGYVLRDGVLVKAATGEPFTFEMLAASRDQQRLFLSYARSLKRAGIQVSLRLTDTAQYERRRQQFDFDMIQNTWLTSLSPGNEQSFRWSRQAADAPGSFNFAGVKSEAVDAMIAAMLKADSREDFVSAVRALDRVLLSGHYVIPLFYPSQQWVAYWTVLHHPAKMSLYGFKIDTWWLADQPGKTPAAR